MDNAEHEEFARFTEKLYKLCDESKLEKLLVVGALEFYKTIFVNEMISKRLQDKMHENNSLN